MLRRSSFFIILFVLCAFSVGQVVRSHFGTEFTTESIREWVQGLGWEAFALYVLLLACRSALLVPSMIILPVGGICFGPVIGTLLGTLGIASSGTVQFFLGRGIAKDFIRKKRSKLFDQWKERIDTAGPILVVGGTLHPASPMTLVHWASGMSSMGFVPFVIALIMGSFLRSALFSFFGSSLLAVGSFQFWLTSGLLLAVIVVPLLHPKIRSWLFNSKDHLSEDEE